MTVDKAVEIFGSRKAIADALGIKVQAVYQWNDVVPTLRVYQIKEILRKRA